MYHKSMSKYLHLRNMRLLYVSSPGFLFVFVQFDGFSDVVFVLRAGRSV